MSGRKIAAHKSFKTKLEIKVLFKGLTSSEKETAITEVLL